MNVCYFDDLITLIVYVPGNIWNMKCKSEVRENKAWKIVQVETHHEQY